MPGVWDAPGSAVRWRCQRTQVTELGWRRVAGHGTPRVGGTVMGRGARDKARAETATGPIASRAARPPLEGDPREQGRTLEQRHRWEGGQAGG